MVIQLLVMQIQNPWNHKTSYHEMFLSQNVVVVKHSGVMKKP